MMTNEVNRTKDCHLRPASLLMVAAILLGSHPCPAGIFVEPYLQSPSADGMSVLWWTDEAEADSSVAFGVDELNGVARASNVSVPSMGKWLHEARLSGLRVGTEYRYRVTSGEFTSKEYSFRTAKGRQSDVRVSFLGDGRTDDDAVIARHRKILKMAGEADIVFEIGDMVYDGSAEHWTRLFRRIVTASDEDDPGCGVGSKVPYHTLVGNHEIYLSSKEEYADGKFEHGYSGGGLHTSMERFKAFASHNPNGSANELWEERYYSMRYGAIAFIVLDANNTSDDALDNHDLLDDGDTPDWEPGSEQHKWMIGELAKARDESVFTFVLFHPSPYCRGEHGAPTGEQDKQRGYQLRVLDATFREYGVDAVVTSHDHVVEHCLTGPDGFEQAMDVDDAKNLNYLVMGNTGHSSRAAGKGWRKWLSVRGDGAEPFHTKWFYTWEGEKELSSFLDVQATNNGDGTWTATFRTVRIDGKIFNEFSLRRKDPMAGSAAKTISKTGRAAERDAGTPETAPPSSRGATYAAIAAGAVAIALAIGVLIIRRRR